MRVWLITGCSSGLGQGIARAVLQSGDAAVVTARDRKHVLHFETEYPGRAMAISMDLAGADSRRCALGNGCYSAAKGALELATEALQKEVQLFGIHTMLVEPGALRTGFYGSRMGETSAAVSAYDEIAEKYRKDKIRDLHDQPGDPDKAGKLIVQTASADALPQRLLLGSDAVRAAENTLSGRLEELRKWRALSVQSDFTRGE